MDTYTITIQGMLHTKNNISAACLDENDKSHPMNLKGNWNNLPISPKVLSQNSICYVMGDNNQWETESP